jgi:hypothetical protein
MNKRIIKDEINYFKSKEIATIAPKTIAYHPINLEIIKNIDPINPICLTKFQIEKHSNNINVLNTYKCKNNMNDYKKNLYIPVIGLESRDLLIIYSIDSIDSLYEWINENLDKLYLKTINRIINCWIRVNFETLKNYNNYLEKICWKIIENKFEEATDNYETNIKKEIKDFIDYWINKHSLDEFNFELIKELIQYLNKKNLLLINKKM